MAVHPVSENCIHYVHSSCCLPSLVYHDDVWFFIKIGPPPQKKKNKRKNHQTWGLKLSSRLHNSSETNQTCYSLFRKKTQNHSGMLLLLIKCLTVAVSLDPDGVPRRQKTSEESLSSNRDSGTASGSRHPHPLVVHYAWVTCVSFPCSFDYGCFLV